MFSVQMHVPDLVQAYAEQALPKLKLRVAKGEQRPAHELRRLQLMVKECMQRARPIHWIFQRFGFWRALSTACRLKLPRTPRFFEAQRRRSLPEMGWDG